MMPSKLQGETTEGLSTELAQEIERALEMLRRVRTAQAASEKREVLETPGNKYELPEALVYPVSSSTHSQ